VTYVNPGDFSSLPTFKKKNLNLSPLFLGPFSVGLSGVEGNFSGFGIFSAEL
jgi:hypothetical protein